MKVLEIKNNLVKISNENGNKLILGGFVVIEDDKTPYVGQIVSLKADNGISYAIARLVFTFDEEGIVKNYDGTIPALNAEVSTLAPADLLDILPVKTPIKLGNLAQQDFVLNVDISLLQNNLLICSDSAKNTSTIVMNFAKQLENNAESSIIFDIDGKFNNEKRFVFGENFKMPLNFESINFIYANDLNDIDATSKAVIQDIFLEVQEYTRTIPEKFIPFDTFIDVVEQQYKESNIPELALLKNKLLKYREEKVFAQSKYEILSLNEYIKDNYTVILDISKAEAKLQKEIITYVYSVIEEMGNQITTFVKINDDNSDKKLIKMLLSQKSANTNIICNHNYKYAYELKEQADNLILFTPETTRHDFASYNTFLNKLNHDEFIVWGKVTQRIPLIVELLPLIIKKEEPIVITMDKPLLTEEALTVEDSKEELAQELEVQDSNADAENSESAPKEAEKEDFTENEDTYTDLSDDIDRGKSEEEDYSALNEGSSFEELPEEDDFDRELNNEIEESLEEREASTNDFFTETKLQDTTEVEDSNEETLAFEDIPEVETSRIQESISAVEMPVGENTKYEEIPNEIPELTFDNSQIEEEISVNKPESDNIVINETVLPDSDETEITSVSSEEIQEEPFAEEDYDEEYIEDDNYVSETPLELNEELINEESLELEETALDETSEEELVLPDPSIDERIEQDLPDVETIFEELPPDVELTPYENTLVQEPAQLMPDDDELREQVAKEIDENFIYNKIEEDTLLEEDSLTEDDLNFIDGINSEDEQQDPQNEKEAPIQEAESDDIPVYAAKAPVTNQKFEAGDRVAHPKYGEGVVEKMIKYGDKTLCSINFANIGRRLLDPAISEITIL